MEKGDEDEKDQANPFSTSVLGLRCLQPYAPLRRNPECERVCLTLLVGGALRRKRRPKKGALRRKRRPNTLPRAVQKEREK